MESLNALLEQAQAYDRTLSARNYEAKAAVYRLKELSELSRNEALELKRRMSGRRRSETPSDLGADHPLTRREQEILTHLTDGLTNKEIAVRLMISARTVQFHVRSVFEKLEVSTRTEAVTAALRRGWVK